MCIRDRSQGAGPVSFEVEGQHALGGIGQRSLQAHAPAREQPLATKRGDDVLVVVQGEQSFPPLGGAEVPDKTRSFGEPEVLVGRGGALAADTAGCRVALESVTVSRAVPLEIAPTGGLRIGRV